MEISQNISLAPFTTFGIGGPARWFAQAASEDEIVEAAEWACDRRVPLFVLGGGSNLLVSDRGFDGLVLRIALRGLFTDPAQPGLLRAAAGEPWEDCVQRSLDASWAGFECLAGIPGAVGGTPVQNVGAYGQEVASVIARVRVFDLAERVFRELTAAECGFSYRRSRFNTTGRDRFIVTRVDYRLTPGAAPTLRYPELVRAVEAAHPGATASLAQVAAIVRRIRQSKGMLLIEGDPDCRSAGSFFKNPSVPEKLWRAIAARSAEQVPHFAAEPGTGGEPRVKIPAAWLIEQAGFAKGHVQGAAGISSRHTLALINCGSGTAAELLALRDQIIAAIFARFGIALEMEPVLLGF